ncbi:uncharacterized protein FIBRA_03483 [Fibroporia radiculosa]|uniref:Sm domain-containing protein n=1 Tax=Fibroporia radiculosa TaxID=599839 RepID=J4I9M7_9APHY|nr:uncharacterized protein FIBRA_03483 [Fibroporia radiculosa]CCM01431.1 predicted protein [Fibroporia radiculosa]
MSDAPPRPPVPVSIQRVKALLRLPIRLSIQDGRIFIGTFAGVDKQLNILLINSEEFRIGADYVDGNPNGRFVGQVMVPWRLVVKVEASVPPESRSAAAMGDGDELYA